MGHKGSCVYIRFLICLRSLRALSVARTRLCSVSLDPDELPEEEEPESEPEYEVSEESVKYIPKTTMRNVTQIA